MCSTVVREHYGSEVDWGNKIGCVPVDFVHQLQFGGGGSNRNIALAGLKYSSH